MAIYKKNTIGLIFFLIFPLTVTGIKMNGETFWRSRLYPENWEPGYTDAEGRFLHDFSYAGYYSGDKIIPETGKSRVVDITKPPYLADNTGKDDVTLRIQRAVNDLEKNGGGVLFFPAGEYLLSVGKEDWGIRIRKNHIVLRGAGVGKTFLKNKSTDMRKKQLILFQPDLANWTKPKKGIQHLTEDILKPTRTIPVQDAGAFKVGETVILQTDCTEDFINEHQCKGLWSTQMKGVVFCRTVTHIDTNLQQIEIDVPTRYFLKRRDNACVYKLNPQLEECGMQDLSIGNIENPSNEEWGKDNALYNKVGTGFYEVHGAHMVVFRNAMNCWMQNVATYCPPENKRGYHILSNGVLIEDSRFITLENCNFQNAQYLGGGGNGYMYTLCANDCLIKNCHAAAGRHNYDFKGMNSNGNVIHQCTSKDPLLASDFHMWFSMANLFDCFVAEGDFIEARFRRWGSGAIHGYTTTESVIWNTKGIKPHASGCLVESRQWKWGYVIGTSGVITKVRTTPVCGKEEINSKKYVYDTSPEDYVEGCTSNETEPLSDYIDTRIGVIDTRGSNCVIGPQLPYGSINPSPQTENGGMDGYHPDYPIRGFGQLHVSGTGWSSYGHFLISPQIGLAVGAGEHDSPHSEGVSQAYYYKTFLERYGITTEIAPAHYSAIYRFTFPESAESHLMFDASQSVVGDIATQMNGTILENSIEVDTETSKIKMAIQFKGGWPGGPYYLYLAGQYNKPAEDVGVWESETVYPGRQSIQKETIDKQHIGAYVKFTTKKDEQVLLKLAISFTSVEKAEEFLDREIPAWDFECVKKQGKKAWDEKLNSIRIETPSEEQKTIFYSAMYRFFTLARDRSLDNSKWESTQPFWDDNYAFWDTFRSAYPLLTLIDEPAMRDNILALIDRFKHNGCVYDGFVAGIERQADQGGNDVDHVIADTYLKGVKGVDWEEAYKILKYNADERRIGRRGKEPDDGTYKKYKELGWIPEWTMSTSQSLEFSYNDYSVALMAKGLGHEDDYKKYSERSHKWVNLWNPDLESHSYTGFIDARREDGTFSNIEPTRYGGSWTTPFYEASSWTYSYYMPHDFDMLIDLMGGREKFIERLTYGFENGLIRYTNEPGFLTTRAFTHAGRPDLSSFWVHDIMNKGFDLTGYPGNDDTGSMGSWYVFCSLGFFPNAGQDYYYLNAPLYSKSVIRLSGGKTLTITANASKENIYIKSCKVNGKEWNSAIIRHSDISDGGKIEMELSNVPTEWGL